jgi:heme-degrading monooxygenase HmoA
MQRRELNDQVTYIEQLGGDDGPIAAINEFNMAPDDTERFVEAWADDAVYMKEQAGFVSTQLHRGTTGSTRSASP